MKSALRAFCHRAFSDILSPFAAMAAAGDDAPASAFHVTFFDRGFSHDAF
jgi:hypothetical protein